MRTTHWRLNSTTPSTRWIQRRLISACRCFRGRHSDPPRPPSSSIPCLIYAAIFPRSSSSATARCNILDQLIPEAGAFYVMDRGYVDFERLARLDDAGSFFVTRAESNLKARRRYSRPVDRSTGLVCDQTVVLTGFYSRQGFNRPLRRIKFNDPQTGKRLVFLTNNFAIDPLTIAKLYKCRWQVEMFFKWIKQHLRIKAFFGTSENAVKSQIWIAVSVYVLVAIVKKRLALPATLYEILQILSLTLFEKTPVNGLFDDDRGQKSLASDPNQLNLFS